MKRNTTNRRYQLLIKTIEGLEHGKCTGLDTYWCCDCVTWLWKWRKISEEEMNSLCDRVTAIIESNRKNLHKGGHAYG